MTADEAREMTRLSRKGLEIEPLMKMAYARIKEAANDGMRMIDDPFGPVQAYSKGITIAMIVALKDRGFKVKRHKNPDPSNPKSTSYISVAW